MFRTSLISPEQPILCIPERPTHTTILTTCNAMSLKLDLGRPGGRSPLTSPNKSFPGNLSPGILLSFTRLAMLNVAAHESVQIMSIRAVTMRLRFQLHLVSLQPTGLQSSRITLLAQNALQRQDHAAVHVTWCTSHGCKLICRLCHQGLAG